MTVDLKGKYFARKSYADIQHNHGIVQSALDGAWHWLNGFIGGAIHFFGGGLADLGHAIAGMFETMVGWWVKLEKLYFHLLFWVQIHVLKYLYNLLMARYYRLLAIIAKWVRYLKRLIRVTAAIVLAKALHAVRMERRARERAIKQTQALAAREDRMLHQTIEREAASAYQMQRDQRVSEITRLLEFAATRNPALRLVISDAVNGLLDLLTIDNFVTRWAIRFAVRHLINHLGVDRLVGTLAQDLIEPLISQPKPRNLHDVIQDMGSRIVAAEAFETTFTTDGGPQVEQAGRLWRDITQPVAAAAIIGFVAAGVVNPEGWATALQGTIGRLGADITDSATRLIKEA